jgi:hypothetical protein
MLLRQEENGFQGKSDTPPEQWFADKPKEYLEMHLIPRNTDLWKVSSFENFIEERKKLIAARFAHLFVQPQPLQA